MPLINCEVSLNLTWSKKCVLTNITTQAARASQGDNPGRPVINPLTNATFQLTDTKLYAPGVTLSTEDDNNFLQQLKSGLKRTIKWNKYRSEMTNQTKTNNLNYLIDPTFNKFNRLFVLSFENEEARTSKYYTSKVKIKDFSLLIHGKSILMPQLKNKEKAYKKLIKISKKLANAIFLLGYLRLRLSSSDNLNL